MTKKPIKKAEPKKKNKQAKIPRISKRAEVQRAFEETLKKYGKVFSELSKL